MLYVDDLVYNLFKGFPFGIIYVLKLLSMLLPIIFTSYQWPPRGNHCLFERMLVTTYNKYIIYQCTCIYPTQEANIYATKNDLSAPKEFGLFHVYWRILVIPFFSSDETTRLQVGGAFHKQGKQVWTGHDMRTPGLRTHSNQLKETMLSAYWYS